MKATFFQRIGAYLIDAIIISLILSLISLGVDSKTTSTELLMTEFYNLLLKGYKKDDAFQLAKKKVRSKKSYASPYYWASFIMLD